VNELFNRALNKLSSESVGSCGLSILSVICPSDSWSAMIMQQQTTLVDDDDHSREILQMIDDLHFYLLDDTTGIIPTLSLQLEEMNAKVQDMTLHGVVEVPDDDFDEEVDFDEVLPLVILDPPAQAPPPDDDVEEEDVVDLLDDVVEVPRWSDEPSDDDDVPPPPSWAAPLVSQNPAPPPDSGAIVVWQPMVIEPAAPAPPLEPPPALPTTIFHLNNTIMVERTARQLKITVDGKKPLGGWEYDLGWREEHTNPIPHNGELGHLLGAYSLHDLKGGLLVICANNQAGLRRIERYALHALFLYHQNNQVPIGVLLVDELVKWLQDFQPLHEWVV